MDTPSPLKMLALNHVEATHGDSDCLRFKLDALGVAWQAVALFSNGDLLPIAISSAIDLRAALREAVGDAIYNLRAAIGSVQFERAVRVMVCPSATLSPGAPDLARERVKPDAEIEAYVRTIGPHHDDVDPRTAIRYGNQRILDARKGHLNLDGCFHVSITLMPPLAGRKPASA